MGCRLLALPRELPLKTCNLQLAGIELLSALKQGLGRCLRRRLMLLGGLALKLRGQRCCTLQRCHCCLQLGGSQRCHLGSRSRGLAVVCGLTFEFPGPYFTSFCPRLTLLHRSPRSVQHRLLLQRQLLSLDFEFVDAARGFLRLRSCNLALVRELQLAAQQESLSLITCLLELPASGLGRLQALLLLRARLGYSTAHRLVQTGKLLLELRGPARPVILSCRCRFHLRAESRL